MLVRAGADHLPVGQNHLRCLERVDRQAVMAHQPADAAAERQAADTRMRHLARGHRQSVLLRGRVELAEQRPTADPDDRTLWVDVDGIQCAQVDAHSAVAHRAARDRVPAGADGERQPSRAGRPDGRRHVVGIGRVDDRRRTTIDRTVPTRACAVVVGVGGLDERAHEASGAQLGREWRGGNYGDGHDDHGRAIRAPAHRGCPLFAPPIRQDRPRASTFPCAPKRAVTAPWA